MSVETTTPDVANQDLVDQAAESAASGEFQGHETEVRSLGPDDVSELGSDAENLGVLLDIDMKVTVELGRTRMKIRDILDLSPGSVVNWASRQRTRGSHGQRRPDRPRESWSWTITSPARHQAPAPRRAHPQSGVR